VKYTKQITEHLCQCGQFKYKEDLFCMTCKSAYMGQKVMLYCYRGSKLEAIEDATGWNLDRVIEFSRGQEDLGRNVQIKRGV